MKSEPQLSVWIIQVSSVHINRRHCRQANRYEGTFVLEFDKIIRKFICIINILWYINYWLGTKLTLAIGYFCKGSRANW